MAVADCTWNKINSYHEISVKKMLVNSNCSDQWELVFKKLANKSKGNSRNLANHRTALKWLGNERQKGRHQRHKWLVEKPHWYKVEHLSIEIIKLNVFLINTNWIFWPIRASFENISQ